MRYIVVIAIILAIIATVPHTRNGGDRVEGYDRKNDMLNVRGENEEMNGAIDIARKTVTEFRNAVKLGVDIYSVKVKVPHDDGAGHFWLRDVQLTEEGFTGLIDNDPVNAKSVKLGDKVSVRNNEISDWMYIKGLRYKV